MGTTDIFRDIPPEPRKPWIGMVIILLSGIAMLAAVTLLAKGC